MSILDKIPERSKAATEVEFALPECGFSAEYPGLYEFIARQTYQGNPRQTGKVVIFADAGKASLCLIDRFSAQVSFFTANSLDEAMRGADKGLAEGGLDWRQDKKASYRR